MTIHDVCFGIFREMIESSHQFNGSFQVRFPSDNNYYKLRSTLNATGAGGTMGAQLHNAQIHSNDVGVRGSFVNPFTLHIVAGPLLNCSLLGSKRQDSTCAMNG